MPTTGVKEMKGNLCHIAELATSSARQRKGIYTWAGRDSEACTLAHLETEACEKKFCHTEKHRLGGVILRSSGSPNFTLSPGAGHWNGQEGNVLLNPGWETGL